MSRTVPRPAAQAERRARRERGLPYDERMNEAHLALCSSPEWARLVEEELLPWVGAGHELGDDLPEIGAGPGLTTDVLRRHPARVTAVELDEDLAAQLIRFAATAP
jgi:protein-L-isoaspartate O-methyltransferase